MTRVVAFAYRLSCAGLAGAQLFFAAVAAQVVFPREVAALPHGAPRRELAADLVGSMLARLDFATLAVAALAVLCALLLQRRRAALLPVLVGLCAALSVSWVTPAIRAMRAAAQTGLPRFGVLHGVSAGLLLAEMLLLVVAVWRSPESV